MDRDNHLQKDTQFQRSRLSLSRSPRDSLKCFEISVPRHQICRIEEKKINRTATFHKLICDLTPEVRDILKILWKKELFFLHNILLPVVRFPC